MELKAFFGFGRDEIRRRDGYKSNHEGLLNALNVVEMGTFKVMENTLWKGNSSKFCFILFYKEI